MYTTTFSTHVTTSKRTRKNPLEPLQKDRNPLPFIRGKKHEGISSAPPREVERRRARPRILPAGEVARRYAPELDGPQGKARYEEIPRTSWSTVQVLGTVNSGSTEVSIPPRYRRTSVSYTARYTHTEHTIQPSPASRPPTSAQSPRITPPHPVVTSQCVCSSPSLHLFPLTRV